MLQQKGKLTRTQYLARVCSVLWFFLFLFVSQQSLAITFSDKYRSPRNVERPVRKATSIIVLHTTEAPAKSSLNKLSERGEANYCVAEDGVVYRLVDVSRASFHAGRSMWQGREDCDLYSVGIEVVGHHDKPVTQAQLQALKELLEILKKRYGLRDDQVVCHSHVAYGAPNKWHPHKHRGRKRCGMLFAMPSVRARLGLKSRPTVDIDLRARRLVQGDQYLHSVLYGSTDTMRNAYHGAPATMQPSAGGSFFSGLREVFKKTPPKEKPSAIKPKPVVRGKLIKSASDKPSDISKEIKDNAAFTKSALKSSSKDKTKDAPKPTPPPIVKGKLYKNGEKPKGDTWYVMLDGKYVHETKWKKDEKIPFGTKVLKGYVLGGPVSKEKNASAIAGAEWKSKDTYYLFRDKLIRGDKIDEKRIESGTMIFYKER